MNFPNDLKYTEDHEWLRVNGNIGTVGITDHAQGELGDVVFVDIDEGKLNVSAGEAFGTIEAVKTVADMLAPVSGKIVEINKSINDNPEIVNNDPYGEGWMVKIEMSDPSEVNKLMDVDAYKQLIGQ
ncbi:glycine cleavage system protein GcvH [Bacteroidetes/Chlorobi group bacterium ChocPot_Mid]|jgi:glycine cleavage system H protein|nr:MAG: glycine cleavage system protein GcvH [Bacteroidetes/Chlorobi group bacterium ChocPot_Mid]